MNLIPWRVRKMLSDRFPLFYHLVRNAGMRSNSSEHWDQRLAQTWDDASRHWPTKNELIASLTRPGDIILDIGCGNGGVLRFLKQRGYAHLHGLEISSYAVQRLAAEGIEMHFGVLPAVALPDAAFDAVIASQVLEHVIRRRRFLREIHRVLKPGGRAFVFVPDDCLGPIDEAEHVIKYNAQTLHKVLSTDFRILRLESISDANHSMSVLFAHVERDAE